MENSGVNLIQFEHIKKVFDGDTVVVEDFNLDVKKGEFVTFLGPSGCGKTTILRMLGGFEIPTAGKILLNGHRSGNRLGFQNIQPDHLPTALIAQNGNLRPAARSTAQIDNRLALT